MRFSEMTEEMQTKKYEEDKLRLMKAEENLKLLKNIVVKSKYLENVKPKKHTYNMKPALDYTLSSGGKPIKENSLCRRINIHIFLDTVKITACKGDGRTPNFLIYYEAECSMTDIDAYIEKAMMIMKKMHKSGDSKQVPIKNGRGEITGYVTLYWSERLGWVSIPKNEGDEK